MRLALASVLAVMLLPGPSLAAPRLDPAVRPVFMAVELVTDPTRDDYTGRVRAEIEVKTTVPQLRLHARELTVTHATVKGATGDIALEVIKSAPDQITLPVPKELTPGRYVLTIDFKNQYSRRAAALYRVQAAGGSYLFTQFEATEAREAFPCWDEPEFKFPWQLTLIVPADQMAVSNTPIEKETPVANGQKQVVFRRTKPLPSYLIAIAVGQFETVPIRGMSVPGRVVCVKGASGLAAEAARVTPPILTALERYFGRPYPYEKLDLIAAPEFLYGAMENAGAIVFADRRLLLDSKASAIEHRRMRAVIAHEIAHQWFGDLVTMRWWDDLWLNESFANWMGTKAMDQVFPEYRSGQAGFDGAYRAVSTDARGSTGAMRQPIESEDNLSANANELTYNKGQAVLSMFEGWLGEKRFRAGVLRYLDKHAWGNATGNDLWTSISIASKENINDAMSSFLDQPGVPLVSIEPLENGRLRLRQERFLSSGEKPEKSSRWKLPVMLGVPDARGGTRAVRVWFTRAETTVTIAGGATAWVLPNSGSSGYYVWQVPEKMLHAMAEDRERLTPVERVGFVRNLIVLQRAGLIPVESYLPILQAFRDDPEPEVTASVIAALEAIREPLVAGELEALFAQQVRLLLQPSAQRLGMEPRPRELPATAAARPKLLLTLGDMGMDSGVRDWARTYTQRVLGGSDYDAALAEAALPLAAQSGDAALAASFRQRFEAATVPTERQQYLEALGRFRDPAICEDLLDFALKGKLRPQEVVMLPFTMAEHPGTRDLLYRWLTTRYSEVLKHVPPHMVVRLMPIVRGCSEQRLADARTFFADPTHTFPGARFVLARTGDAVDDCVRVSKRDGSRFADWLRSTSSAQ